MTSLLATGAAAQDHGSEVWSGAEVVQRAWSVYAGTTYATSGAIDRDGTRLRFVAGQSQYRFAAGAGRGISPFADAFAGYHRQLGSLTIKVFAGVGAVANLESPQDQAEVWAHTRFGPKLALENWWAIDEGSWASLDVSWSGAQQAVSGRLRAALRVQPHLSLGLEGGLVGTASTGMLKAGPFLRYEWREGEVSLSGGVAGEGALGWPAAAGVGRDAGGYATLNWLQRF